MASPGALHPRSTVFASSPRRSCGSEVFAGGVVSEDRGLWSRGVTRSQAHTQHGRRLPRRLWCGAFEEAEQS